MAENLKAIAAIVAKDCRIEWRTKTALGSSMALAVLVLMIIYIARDTARVSALDVAPAALWIPATARRAAWCFWTHKMMDSKRPADHAGGVGLLVCPCAPPTGRHAQAWPSHFVAACPRHP